MASELEKENARLRGELAQVKAQLDRLQNPEEVTLNLLASKMQTLMDSQTVQLEGKLNALLGDAGARAPPPSALPLAEVMHDMEDLGMTEAQVQRAHEIFDMYDDDCSGSIDNDEMMSILRLLGENPTYDEVEAMIAEVDENQNGDLTLNEFLVIYARTEQAQQEADAKLGPETPTKGRSRRAMRSMNDMSFYGVGALMRWVKVDGDEFGGDVTHHPGIPCHRRTARQMAMNKGVESVFYLCICLSALNSGLQTYPEFEKSSPVVMLGRFTNFMVRALAASMLVACHQPAAAFATSLSAITDIDDACRWIFIMTTVCCGVHP